MESEQASMLTIENVTKRFGEIVALDRVSLSLARGEFFGLLGPNGAGKTTLMSLVAGLRAPDSGSISISGQRVGPNAMAPRHELGFVPQAIALYEELSAEENLRLFGKLYGLAGQELRARVDHGLHAAQLFERRQDKVQTYSGGMKRRINVVASILHRPALLLCDEPTVGVDPQSRNAIFEFLQRLNADGMTIVYSTHYMEEATRLCSRIAIIDHGRLLALGTLDELLTHLPFSELVRIARNDQTTAQMQALAEYGEITKAEDAYLFKLRDGLRFSEFFAAAEELGLPYRYFNIRRPTLEDLFLHLTGKNLRDT
jgi:ABC-2 type transport system ATP-binding protein